MGVPTGQDPTQLSCYLVKEKDLGSLLFLKSNNKGKCLQMQKACLHPQQGAILGSVLSFSEGYTTKKIGESSSVVKESH